MSFEDVVRKSSYVPKKQKKDEEETKVVTSTKLIHAECLELLQFRNHEEEKSARLYENMYMYLNNMGYIGAGKLWHKYAHEELVHADWARDYMLSLGIQPELREMPKLDTNYKGLEDIINLSYEHELLITEQCNALASCALEHKDFMLFSLASKYLTEQIEELDKIQNWVDQIKLFGTSQEAMRLLDNEMAKL